MLLLLINACFLISTAGAEETGNWEPPEPRADEFDWIQLTSDEWLKGEVKGLYDKELDFDSDKLKLQTFHWKDVKRVKSPRVFGVRVTGPVTVFGSLDIDEHKVIVTLGGKKKEFARDQLIAIAPTGKREIDYWGGKLSFGINVSKGNTDQVTYNAGFDVQRSTATTRLMVDYYSNISETNGEKTVDNSRVQGQFDIFKTRKYSFRPIFGEYYTDPFKNIKYKISAGTGMGYYFINNPRTDFEIGGGPGYQVTKFESVEVGQDQSESSASFLGMVRYNTWFTDDINFDFKYTFQILNKVSGKYTHHFITTADIKVTHTIDLNVSFTWDRVQDPKPDENGVIPLKDDFNLVVGLGIQF